MGKRLDELDTDSWLDPGAMGGGMVGVERDGDGRGGQRDA